ncbi:Maf family protein [Leptospira kanakyensis]|uniref:dTTP/UTP pyrophosphatase n=1 Tax=Leptospira kanakyensis TaxID=2484968 RepID=A0A6N4QCD7_9LEPT|nr:Maf family protein [Leptospira kanakyensis]MCW7469158.1 Maf family protein [Leptospira kanakyensis]TGK50356.1 Maf-like protein [Leptospira kanakyensis]TGK64042.1 Maf-like protein [Leptospira kanakyensis]TGK69496.1 Maf-like protein [Leptospira kanakyensis]
MFILKSTSPRRIQILTDLGFLFQVTPANIDESQNKQEPALRYLERMVHSKLGQDLEPNHLYLAADTIVVFKDEILHKPTDLEDAVRILQTLSGKKHSVFSGAGLQTARSVDFFYEETVIQFKDWNEDEIRDYILRCQPFDKAGSYGIQDENGPVLERVGSYTNVMGFPLRSFFARSSVWLPYWERSFKRID